MCTKFLVLNCTLSSKSKNKPLRLLFFTRASSNSTFIRRFYHFFTRVHVINLIFHSYVTQIIVLKNIELMSRVAIEFIKSHLLGKWTPVTKMAIIEYLISLSTQLLPFSLFTRIGMAIIDWLTYYCGSLIYLYEILSNAIIAIHWNIFIEQLVLGIHLLLLIIVVLWLLDLLLSLIRQYIHQISPRFFYSGVVENVAASSLYIPSRDHSFSNYHSGTVLP